MSRAPSPTKEPLLNQQAPDLNDPTTVSRLSRGLPAGIRMLEQLQLNREQQGSLLGLSSRSLQRASNSAKIDLTQDQLTRLSLVVGLYKALHILYDEHTAAGWLRRTNARFAFGGQTPFEYMRQGGIPAMYQVRQLLDADRSGMFSVTPEARKAASKFETVLDL
jgi:hypothetical protein